MKTPDMAARSWYEKTEHEDDDFDRFVYLWFSFNVLYNEYFYSNERQAIIKYVRNNLRFITNIDQIFELDDTKYFYNRVIKNCKVDDRKDTTEDTEILWSGTIKVQSEIARKW